VSKGWRAVLFASAVVSGCNGGPAPRPELPDLSEARRLAAGGWVLEAAELYADLYEDAGDAPEQSQARAMIAHELHRIGAPAAVAQAPPERRAKVLAAVPAVGDASGRDLLSAALAGYSQALATTVDAREHEACARAVGEILRLKAATPAARRWGGGEPFAELLYARLLAEAIADYELFALARRPGSPKSGEEAAAALEAFAARCQALVDHPATLPPAVRHWESLARKARASAVHVRVSPAEVKLDPETRSMVESDADGQLRLVMEAHDLAVRRRTGNEPPELQIAAYEDALRHAVMAIETIARPTPRQSDALANARVDFEELKRLSVKP
jgi:hypothetical protein